ncbi:MAG: hypothetical protein IPI30_14205 [Saprospiraceae bacterium]|nr:hypothetical protein [Candidatus Vicinibacter affinis]
MHDFMKANGYEAYEISNFSQAGHRAIHNSNYWNGLPYLGWAFSTFLFGNTQMEHCQQPFISSKM